MKKYQIPNTDLEVSRLAFGTWHLGGSWDETPLTDDLRERAVNLINAVVDNGINMIDLADIYTKTKSDEVIGHVLKQQPNLREKLVLQEKCGIRLRDKLDDVVVYDFSYDHIMSTVENSLRLLNTDYVDLLLLHRPDPLIEPEEVARAFDDLQSSGKVRYFGVSNHTPMQIELLKKVVNQPLVANQVKLNLLHNQLIRDGIVANTTQADYTGASGTLDYCRVNDMQIQAWSPVAGGQLFTANADSPTNVQAAAAEVQQLAEKYDVPREAIVLAWLLRHPAGILPIIGTMKPERIATSCRADEVDLTRMEWYRLFEAANGTSVP
jgi:predicted oxidoreductase